MERDAFIARVKAAARAARLPDADPPGLVVPDLPEVDLTEAFVAALGRVGGVAHRDDPVEVVLALADRLGTSEYLGWDDEWLPPGVGAGLRHGGLSALAGDVPSDAEGRRRHQSGYFDVVLGVTGAEAGFAETGTVVIRSGPGRPRMASLIPEVHVVILAEEAICRSLAHWAEANAGAIVDAANVVFVTGPSRTGDIEMRLNVGVHGPREVHVILV